MAIMTLLNEMLIAQSPLKNQVLCLLGNKPYSSSSP